MIDDMTEMPSNATAGESTHTTPSGVAEELRELRRSQTNRVVAGVLGGLGRRLGIDPLVLRVVTAVLALFGGAGIMLYALAWLLIPAEGEQASVLDQAIGRREVRDAAAVPLALGLGAVFVISSGVIIGSSWNAWILLVLAGAGLFVLMRRQNEPGPPGHDVAGPAYEPPSGPAYQPWASVSPQTDTPSWHSTPGVPSAGETAAGTSSTGTEAPADIDQAHTDDATSPHQGTTADRHQPPGAEEGAAMPGATENSTTDDTTHAPASGHIGTGWPEGPDWGVPQPEPSPYDELYLQRSPEPPKEKPPRSVLGPVTFCVALVSVGLVALADALSTADAGPLYFAAPLVAVAIGLLIGTWYGRSRGLIMLGLLLSLALVPATLISQWDVSAGPNEIPPPTTVAELPSEPLTHGAGPFTYDLSELELTDDDQVSLTMQLGMGPLTVTVPEDADVFVDATAGMGQLQLFDISTAGMGREQESTDLGPDGPGGGQIELDLEVGMGNIEVVRADTEVLP